ncbi:MAG TPA: DMT family transporter [Candidatus Binatia bacterium]
MASPTLSRLAVVAAALLFSTGGAAIKLVSLPALQIAGLRAGIAAVTLLVLLRLPLRSFGAGSLLTGAAQAATMALFVIGNKLTTAAATIFLQSTAPLYVLALSPALLGERIRRADVGFLALFALGLALFFVDVGPAQATAPDPLLGNLAACGSGLAWAGTVLGLRWLALRQGRTAQGVVAAHRALGGPREANPVAAATVLGNVLVFVGCLPWLLPLPALSAAELAVVLWLGVAQVGLAYFCLAYGIRHVRAFDVTMLLLLEPVLNPVWAWLLHGETPGAWALAGGVVILATSAARTWYNPPP